MIGNVLVQTQNGGLKTYKVCDFGLSRTVNHGRFSATTTTTTNIPRETTKVATSRVNTVTDGTVGRTKEDGGKGDGDGGSGMEEEGGEFSGSSDGQQSNANTLRRCHRPIAQILTNSMTGGLGKMVGCGVA